MKSYQTIIAALLITNSVISQSTTILSQNNVSAHLQDEGFFFNDVVNSIAGYEVPAGSGIHSIYSSSFWMGGRDVNNQLNLSAQTYLGDGTDYEPGFLSNNGVPIDPNPFNQSIWQITKAEIDSHILNYQSPGYVVPNDIANWPAQGVAGWQMPIYIAPFVDVNLNSIYEPSLGDYPCIKGDEAVYIVMREKGFPGLPVDDIEAELHYMFYQYSSIPELNDVTFVELEIVNNGTQTIFDFHATYFLDADLGNGQDDFVGCDTTRNLIFAYNGDALDESGYGANPPALGVVLLSHNMDYSMALSSSSPGPQNTSVADEYYNLMQGKYSDGTDQLDNNGNPTNYMFHGDPNDPAAWSENSSGAVPGDRKMIISSNLGTLTPAIDYLETGTLTTTATGRRKLTYAVMHAQGSSNLNSVTLLYQFSDYVQSFYDGMIDNCFDQSTLSIEEKESLEFNLYPNPSNGSFTIDLPEVEGEVEIEIVDLSGRIVFSETYYNTDRIQIHLDESNGMYVLKTKINSKAKGPSSSAKRLILD